MRIYVFYYVIIFFLLLLPANPYAYGRDLRDTMNSADQTYETDRMDFNMYGTESRARVYGTNEI